VESVEDFLAQPVGLLLEDVASERPAPGGGSVAALAVALAAGLAAMAARLSVGRWDDAAATVERADALRKHAAPLAPADARAYEEVITALRLQKHLEPVVREAAIESALSRAADLPLEIARAGAEVALLAADAAEHGNPNLRGDATAGALLAAAAARAAANLVEINLAASPGDDRIQTARTHVLAAADAADRALKAR
jgi:glutamate formiminotransferase/formiminotetrahydrofolate cyclodeaminase